MIIVQRSSRDLIADRRFIYGEALLLDGDAAAAAELFEQALECAPDWPDGFAGLARARLAAGDAAASAAAWRRVLELEPDDVLGARLHLAVLGERPAPPAPPPAYVAALFDQYAPEFEAALVGRLRYAGPEVLAGLVAETARHFTRAVDIGCGTGLMGAALRADVDRLEGIDLSRAMLEEAASKGIYDELVVGDVVAVLSGRAGCYDLVLAADVLCYLGDLGPVFTAVARAMEAGGLFAFTIEALSDDEPESWALRPSLRYGHRPEWVIEAGRSAGLTCLRRQEIVLRLDGGMPIVGAAFLMVREV